MSENDRRKSINSLVWIKDHCELLDLLWRDDTFFWLNFKWAMLTFFWLNSIEFQLKWHIFQIKRLVVYDFNIKQILICIIHISIIKYFPIHFHICYPCIFDFESFKNLRRIINNDWELDKHWICIITNSYLIFRYNNWRSIYSNADRKFKQRESFNWWFKHIIKFTTSVVVKSHSDWDFRVGV